MKPTNATLIKKYALLAVKQIAPSHGDCEPLNRIVKIAELMENTEERERAILDAALIKLGWQGGTIFSAAQELAVRAETKIDWTQDIFEQVTVMLAK